MSKGRSNPNRITVTLDPDELAELEQLAARDRLPLAAAFRMAARTALGRPAVLRRPDTAFDEGFDHALQQELILLNLIGIEQVLKLLETVTPYGAGAADEHIVPAAQAAQQRIARGIPDALGGPRDER